jgi:hypothetical protein
MIAESRDKKCSKRLTERRSHNSVDVVSTVRKDNVQNEPEH